MKKRIWILLAVLAGIGTVLAGLAVHKNKK